MHSPISIAYTNVGAMLDWIFLHLRLVEAAVETGSQSKATSGERSLRRSCLSGCELLDVSKR